MWLMLGGFIYVSEIKLNLVMFKFMTMEPKFIFQISRVLIKVRQRKKYMSRNTSFVALFCYACIKQTFNYEWTLFHTELSLF